MKYFRQFITLLVLILLITSCQQKGNSIVIEDDVDDLEEEPAEEDMDAPDIQLTGVIITPSIRMATLRQEGEKLSGI